MYTNAPRLPVAAPRRSWLRLAALAVLCAAITAGVSWLVRGSQAPATTTGSMSRGVDAGLPALDVPATDGLLPPSERVAFWERRVAAGGGYLDLVHLADAYIDRTRASGDLADLRRAEIALDEALPTAPNPIPIRVREAQVAFSLHEFARSLEIGDEVLATEPGNLAALTVAGDSLLELGQVDAAAALYERLGIVAPSPASWSRLSRLAYLRGDVEQATRLVSRAATEAAASGFPDEVAFYNVQLGDLDRALGRLPDAAAAYEAALAALPGHPAASVGLAHVREAQGRRDEAISLVEDAVARLPQPEYVATLGDLYALRGDADAADQQYALVDAIAGLDGEAVYDRIYVGFLADHGRNVDEAVARARAELEVRSDVHGHDALAWALFAAGKTDAAADAADEALALGTPDPRIRYHAGLIAAAQGRDAEALELLTAARDGAAMLPPLQVARLDAALAELEARRS